MPDVVVLGGGPAGYSCALRLADLGITSTLVEARQVGGTCLHRGCIPTRATLEGAAIVATLERHGPRWGIGASVTHVDLPRLKEARDEVVHRNHAAIRRHLAHAGVERVEGFGRLTGARTVAVDGRTITAGRALVVATGSRLRRFAHIEPDGRRVLTTDDAFDLDYVPRRALILGGGAVGAEFSQIWRALGAEVTILEREAHLVPFEDAAVGERLARALRRVRIRVVTGIHVAEVRTTDDGVEVDVTRAGKTETHSGDVLLLAAGRSPATEGIGLEEAGVELERGHVAAPDCSTSVPGVYAAGDVLAPPSNMRANVAYVEGMLVADRIAGVPTPEIDHTQIPRITHGMTETACVGISEERARAEGLEPRSLTMELAGVPMGSIAGEPGMAKVVTDGEGTIVGIHLVGPRASELIGGAAALTSFEASAAEAATLVQGHPTLSETLQELYLALSGRRLHVR